MNSTSLSKTKIAILAAFIYTAVMGFGLSSAILAGKRLDFANSTPDNSSGLSPHCRY